MRILCLSKRRPQGRDLLDRPYGRFFHLPYHLARQGHEVTIALLSYADDPPEHRVEHGLEWYSESVFPLWANRGPMRYLARVNDLAADVRPDWIVGFSDTWYGILAQHLGERYGSRSLIDAYDNYQSYIPWAKPLHWQWRRALRRANAVSAAGPQLAGLMVSGSRHSQAAVLPMAADPIFQRLDRQECRARLGLPQDVPLVGYCGSLFQNRGIEALFRLVEQFRTLSPHTRLVISGRREAGVELPASLRERIIECGYLPDHDVPSLINAVDVLLTINRPSKFGDYSYPVKIYEAIACGVPVVATAVGGTTWILRDHPECLADPGDGEGFARKVVDALALGRKAYTIKSDWADVAQGLAGLMENARETDQRCPRTM